LGSLPNKKFSITKTSATSKNVPCLICLYNVTISPPAQNALPLPFSIRKMQQLNILIIYVKKNFLSVHLIRKATGQLLKKIYYLHHDKPDIWIILPRLIQLVQPNSLHNNHTHFIKHLQCKHHETEIIKLSKWPSSSSDS
jgi:hypothetical protein